MKPAMAVEVLVNADGYRRTFHCNRLVVLGGAHEVSSLRSLRLVATIFANSRTLSPAVLDRRSLAPSMRATGLRGLILPSVEPEVVDCDGVCSHSVDTLQQDRVGADGHLRIGTEISNDDQSGEVGGSDPKRGIQRQQV